MLGRDAALRDFVNDAYAHAKFIGYTRAVEAMFELLGQSDLDAGFIALDEDGGAEHFITACKALRFWEREGKVHAV